MNLESNILSTPVSTGISVHQEVRSKSQAEVSQVASSDVVNKLDPSETTSVSRKNIEKRVISSEELERKARLLTLSETIQKSWYMPNSRSASVFVNATHEPFKPHFFISNEFPNSPGVGTPKLNFTETIRAIGQKKVVEGETLRVAMLVGESSLLASLPELVNSCEMVLLTDYDEELLFCLLDQIEYIKSCSEIEDESRYLNQVEHNIKASFQKFKTDYGISRQGLSELHPFSSVERLKAVKEAISRVMIIPVPINLFNDVSKIAVLLYENKAEIQVINLSNVFEGIPSKSIAECCIKLLPLSENALCADSFLRKREYNQTRVFKSRRAYLDTLENKENSCDSQVEGSVHSICWSYTK